MSTGRRRLVALLALGLGAMVALGVGVSVIGGSRPQPATRPSTSPVGSAADAAPVAAAANPAAARPSAKPVSPGPTAREGDATARRQQTGGGASADEGDAAPADEGEGATPEGSMLPASERKTLRRRLMRACEEERFGAALPPGRRLREGRALDWNATLCLASALRNTGHSVEARALYTAFLAQFPENKFAPDARRAIAELDSPPRHAPAESEPAAAPEPQGPPEPGAAEAAARAAPEPAPEPAEPAPEAAPESERGPAPEPSADAATTPDAP